MSIVMIPPEGHVPFKRIKLSSTGREVFPDRETSTLRVLTDGEAKELEAEGWSRQVDKSIDVGDLKKAVDVAARRIGIATPTTIEIAIDELRRRAVLAELRHGKHDIEDHP